MSIIDKSFSSPNTILERWVEIDVRLSSLVLSYVRNPASSHPEFDSSETLRGYGVIKCTDLASLDFLTSSVAKISDVFEDIKVKLILAKDIPKRPRALILLPLAREARRKTPPIYKAVKQGGEAKKNKQTDPSVHLRRANTDSIKS